MKQTRTMTGTEQKELFFCEGINYIPKILGLLDKNKLHSTYGCFDRAFWHYRTADFPSGMYQEAVLPLALAYNIDHEKNPYFGQARLKEFVIAGIEFAQRSSHPDGSCDDYFPFEKAAGAAAFSLYACTEAYLELGLNLPHLVEFFRKRADYLSKAGFGESGILSNHKALIVLALYNTALISGNKVYADEAAKKTESLLALQNQEGWFPEYEGCDPGYLTFTIDFLAKYYQKSSDERIKEPLKRAISFSAHFLHPDGSFGGEYGSRNTFHYLPHGFEIMGVHEPRGLRMNDFFADGIAAGKRCYIDDDRIFIHYTYNFMQAARDYVDERGPSLETEPQPAFVEYPEAGLVIRQWRDYYAVISLKKAGAAKIYKGKELILSDAGIIGRTKAGKTFTTAGFGKGKSQTSDDSASIEGNAFLYKEIRFSGFVFLLFRLFQLTAGRFMDPNIVRRIIQRVAITKKTVAVPLHFKKVFYFTDPATIEYQFDIKDPELEIEQLWIGSDPTFIYVATSQPYQQGNLKGWVDLSQILPELNRGKKAAYKHKLI